MRKFLLAASAAAMISCALSPRDITYGTDVCNYCKMTIVDDGYAAQLVTEKGKIYVFDAIECMINHTRGANQIAAGMLLVNSPVSPGELFTAENCTFLVSEALPSPMGANLTAFPDASLAHAMQLKKGGDLYDWSSLQIAFRQHSGHSPNISAGGRSASPN